MTKSRINFVQMRWDQLRGKPFGKAIFSYMFGKAVPYTHTIKAQVLELKPGFSRLVLKDRKQVRNHLGSIHAVALANLGEFSTGLAFHYAMPNDVRAIITKLTTEYLKKARGTLIAECQCPVLESNAKQTLSIESVIRDADGDVVAKVTGEWLVGPRR